MELLDELVPRVRDHYVEHFRAFVSLLRSTGKRGAAEVKFKLSGENSLFGRIACVDYVENGGEGVVMHYLEPDKKLSFESFSEVRGDASINAQSLCWDDISISFDGPHADYEAWFEKWFDPEDHNTSFDLEFTEKVHALSLGERNVVVDFGTAPAKALHDLLDLIIAAGSQRLTLSTTR